MGLFEWFGGLELCKEEESDERATKGGMVGGCLGGVEFCCWVRRDARAG